MSKYSLSQLSDDVLLRDFRLLDARDRATSAELLAHVAEIDGRKLYVPAGYSSMFVYCVEALHWSEDVAYKRIRAARSARRFPVLFDMLADGRLHLSAIVLLAPYLTHENCRDLVAAATHRSKAETERLIAARFPRPDLPAQLVPIGRAMGAPVPEVMTPNATDTQLAPGPVETTIPEHSGSGSIEPESSSALLHQLAPGPVAVARARLTPLSAQGFALQATLPPSTHDKLRRIQELAGHEIPAGDLVALLDQSFDAMLEKLERRKCGATTRPRTPQPQTGSSNPRYVPRHVKRAVWGRDDGQCTFTSDDGHRCKARRDLELDHIEPVARGGHATVGNLRLRCRAHNQFEADCAFGAGFMHRKREAAQAT